MDMFRFMEKEFNRFRGPTNTLWYPPTLSTEWSDLEVACEMEEKTTEQQQDKTFQHELVRKSKLVENKPEPKEPPFALSSDLKY